MAAPGRHLGTFFGAAAVVVVLDQLTKQWALSRAGRRPDRPRRLAAAQPRVQRPRRVLARLREHHRRSRSSGCVAGGRAGGDGRAGRAARRGRSGWASSSAARSATSTDRGVPRRRRVPRRPRRRHGRPPVVAGVQPGRRRALGGHRRAPPRRPRAPRRRAGAVIVREVVPEALAGERVDRVVAMVTGLSRNEVAELVDAGAVLRRRRGRSRPAPPGCGRRRGRGRRARPRPPAPSSTAEPDVDVPVVHEDDAPARDRQARRAGGAPGRRAAHRHPRARACWRATPSSAASATIPSDRASCTGSTRARPGSCSWPAPPTAYAALVAALVGPRRCTGGTAPSCGATSRRRAGLIDAPIGRSAREPTRMAVDERGKEARTRYEVLRALRRAGRRHRARVHLETGRTHQIRVHLRSIGHPVVGDAALRRRAPVAPDGPAVPPRRAPRARPPGHRRRRSRSTSPLPDGPRGRCSAAPLEPEVAASRSGVGQSAWPRAMAAMSASVKLSRCWRMRLADARPHRQQHALALVVAGAVLVGLAEVAEGDRAVDGRHDLAEGDRGSAPWRGCSRRPTPALRAHDARRP